MGTDDEDDLTLAVLREIRDEIKKTNERLDKTNERLDRTNEHMAHEFTAVRGEITDVARDIELRLSTRFTELISATRNMYEMLHDRFELRDRVEQCERDIAELKQRAG